MSDIGLKRRELDTPVLWVDLDLLEQNIATLARHFLDAGVHWRPHMKGVKVPALAHKVMDAGAIGVTCAKLSEAEVMAAAGIKEILIANQVVGTRKITRLVQLCRTNSVKVAVDGEPNVRALSAAATAADVVLELLVEVDSGMGRTGVAPGPQAVHLAQTVHALPGLRLAGLMAWEGHTLVHEDPAKKRAEIVKSVERLTQTAALCREAGLPVEIVSGGGSGTYKVTPFLPGMTEIQAGGAIFSDVAYSGWGVTTTPALFVRSIVTSRPAPDRIIFDAGFKAMPAWHATPRPVGLEGVARFTTSAEHGVLTLEKKDTSIRVGDVFDFVVGYTDATLFLHDRLYGIRDGVVEVVWEIAARGKLH